MLVTKLKFISSPTERTTAITDILLALAAGGAVIYLQCSESHEIWKINTWSRAFALIALAGFLGAIAHGLELTEAHHRRIWHVINLSLGLSVSIFVIGVAYDLWGLAFARKMLPWMIGCALLFLGVTRLFAGIFFVFILYEATALLFAFAAYGWLSITDQLNGATLMAAGVLASVIAAGIQASKKMNLKLVFEFDHNGIFHIVQILGIFLLVAGLKASLLPDS
ncbi:MAG: hypothetical protein JRF72_22725 [Deltaproteobacteria bacterium]|nr:hypothetical protein [Deltaproteobacteria bacterium]